MGVFSVPIEIASYDGDRFERIETVVDTGAAYTMLPPSILDGLGITPSWNRSFALADGAVRQFDMAEAQVRLDDITVTTIVVFNEEDAEPLLGAYTLEGLGLAVDPVGQDLMEFPYRA